jgi:secondary thiamine-phosphate synthase enzyme
VEIRVDTSDSRVVDLTREVEAFCRGQVQAGDPNPLRRGDGLVHVFAPHATAGIALIEVGAGSDSDLVATLERLLPRDGRWSHKHGSPGHGADHVLPAIVAPFVVLPVLAGSPALGTWQSIVFVDLNVDNPVRRVRLSFIAG